MAATTMLALAALSILLGPGSALRMPRFGAQLSAQPPLDPTASPVCCPPSLDMTMAFSTTASFEAGQPPNNTIGFASVRSGGFEIIIATGASVPAAAPFGMYYKQLGAANGTAIFWNAAGCSQQNMNMGNQAMCVGPGTAYPSLYGAANVGMAPGQGGLSVPTTLWANVYAEWLWVDVAAGCTPIAVSYTPDPVGQETAVALFTNVTLQAAPDAAWTLPAGCPPVP
jgi:hypothetical protein